ncbi:MAG: Mur ligase family protein [Opitutales bacterium]
MSGFCQDSRRLCSGDMFVAVRAERDGHDFIRQAAVAGASAALVERYVRETDLPQLKAKDAGEAFLRIARGHRMRFPGKVVGITGSCGKTSTKDALQLLLGRDTCLATEGNFNNLLGVPLTLLRLEPELHKRAVVEAGINQPGEMERLARAIAPDLALVTMVGPSHLEGLGAEEKVASEKARLIRDAESVSTAIFPEDCLRFDAFREILQGEAETLVLKRGNPQEEPPHGIVYFNTSTETNEVGDAASLWLKRRGYPALAFCLPLVSEGMASNCALAVTAALELGISTEEISERLPLLQPSALRGKRLRGRGNLYYLDCYNANPTSMLDTLRFFQRLAGEVPKLYALGGMEELGEDGPRLHRETGAKLHLDSTDRVLLVGEKASWMREGILSAGADEGAVNVTQDIEEARGIVADFEGAVLLKGSRVNALETLVPEWAIDEENADHARC